MSQSIKPGLAFAILISVGLITGALLLSRTTKSHTKEFVETVADTTDIVDISTNRIRARHKRETSITRREAPARQRTTGVMEMPAHREISLPQVSGYVVDNFSDWKSIPQGYASDGIVLSNGQLTLTGDAASTGPKSGFLRSPALPLKAPSLSGAVSDPKQLVEGQSILLQISLSADGKDWSPWILADRHHKPEGNLVAPPMQPSIANADLHNSDSISSVTVSGPSIRYRLSISSSGAVSPTVSDVRIWKREYR